MIRCRSSHLSRPVSVIALAALGLSVADAARPAEAPCRGNADTAHEHCESLSFGGRERTYRLYVPSQLAARVPLLLVLHPALFDGVSMEAITARSFDQHGNQAGALIVYPDGIDQHWNDGREGIATTAAREHIDDVGFLRTLVAVLSARYPVDTERVFVTGFSNGGMMTLRLACEATDVFRGFVAVAASLSEELAARCQPQVARRVALIDGTADGLVPYGGGGVGALGITRGRVVGAEATFDAFRKLAGCSGAGSEPLPGKTPRDRTDVIVHRATGCPADRPVVLFEIKGGGHAWPGGARVPPQVFLLRGKLSGDIDATEEAWRFLGLGEIPAVRTE